MPVLPSDPPGGVVPPGGIPRPDAYGQTPESPPIIYLIRHGEKNPTEAEGSLIGLSADGVARADALPEVFNNDGTNPYNIRLLFAMRPKANGGQGRPWQTVIPLSISLQQTLVASKDDKYLLVDNTVPRDSEDKLAKTIKDYIKSGGTGNILICWEHHRLQKILEAFEFPNAPDYPGMFDVVWMLKPMPVEGSPLMWSWDTVKWSSERTKADVELADDGKKWTKKAKISESLVTQSSTPGVPQYQWNPSKKKDSKSDDDDD